MASPTPLGDDEEREPGNEVAIAARPTELLTNYLRTSDTSVQWFRLKSIAFERGCDSIPGTFATLINWDTNGFWFRLKPMAFQGPLPSRSPQAAVRRESLRIRFEEQGCCWLRRLSAENSFYKEVLTKNVIRGFVFPELLNLKSEKITVSFRQ